MKSIKRLTLIFLLPFGSRPSPAQQPLQEGAIIYLFKIRLPEDGPAPSGSDPSQARYFTNREQLFFNRNESLYVPLPDQSPDFESNSGGMQIRIMTPNNEIYFNDSTFRKVALMEFMGANYLITDPLKIKSWRFGPGIKIIQNYPCREASYHDDSLSMDVTVWYTDQLRPMLGPEDFNSLPGTVLEVDIDHGKRIITAEKLEFRLLKKNELKIPRGGKPVTGPEFDKMVKAGMALRERNGDRVIINR